MCAYCISHHVCVRPLGPGTRAYLLHVQVGMYRYVPRIATWRSLALSPSELEPPTSPSILLLLSKVLINHLKVFRRNVYGTSIQQFIQQQIYRHLQASILQTCAWSARSQCATTSGSMPLALGSIATGFLTFKDIYTLRRYSANHRLLDNSTDHGKC